MNSLQRDATDNIYFTWNGLTPTKINYGAGEQLWCT